jgi:hypothetical protein
MIDASTVGSAAEEATTRPQLMTKPVSSALTNVFEKCFALLNGVILTSGVAASALRPIS